MKVNPKIQKTGLINQNLMFKVTKEQMKEPSPQQTKLPTIFRKKVSTSEDVDNLKRFQMLRFFGKIITEEIDELARPVTIFDIEQIFVN